MAADSWYDRHLLPRLLDLGCRVPAVAARRQDIVPQASGRVLEVGIGTGLNLAYYDPARVSELVGIDPATQLHPKARQRIGLARIPVSLQAWSAERLPIPDQSFDTVVCTWTLCSVPDPAAALAEMRRVLRPGGRLLLAEHGLAPDASVARWQARLEPYWSRIAGGCHLTRDVPRLLQDAGFHAQLDTGYIARPRLLGYHYWGHGTP